MDRKPISKPVSPPCTEKEVCHRELAHTVPHSAICKPSEASSVSSGLRLSSQAGKAESQLEVRQRGYIFLY